MQPFGVFSIKAPGNYGSFFDPRFGRGISTTQTYLIKLAIMFWGMKLWWYFLKNIPYSVKRYAQNE